MGSPTCLIMTAFGQTKNCPLKGCVYSYFLHINIPMASDEIELGQDD